MGHIPHGIIHRTIENDYTNPDNYKKNMKSFRIILSIMAVCIVALSGCKKEEVYKTFEKPHWKEVFDAEYTTSMTAIIDLPRELAVYANENDELAAFVNGECRGIAVKVDGLNYIMIKCKPDEDGMVTFKYYSAANKYMYQCVNCTPLENDGIYGTADSPIVIPFKVINE